MLLGMENRFVWLVGCCWSFRFIWQVFLFEENAHITFFLVVNSGEKRNCYSSQTPLNSTSILALFLDYYFLMNFDWDLLRSTSFFLYTKRLSISSRNAGIWLDTTTQQLNWMHKRKSNEQHLSYIEQICNKYGLNLFFFLFTATFNMKNR